MNLKKLSVILLSGLYLISNSYASSTIYTSVSVFEDYLNTKIQNKKVLNKVIDITRYNYDNFINGFIAKYNSLTNVYYDPVAIAEAVMPSVFYKAYNAFVKLNNEENPYLTTNTLINKERSVINEYKNGNYKKYLKDVNISILNKIKDGTLYSKYVKSIDPIALIKYEINYATKIINNRQSNYIATNVEKEGKDYLKNKLGIKNNRCDDYKTCAKKAFIGNNGDNIPEDKLSNVNINTIFNNNIRSLTLEQSNLFILDFIVSKFLPVIYNKNNGIIYNRINLYNKKTFDYNQSPAENTNIIKIYNKLLNLRLLYTNVLDIVNRYYYSPKRVLTSLLGCSVFDTISKQECNMIKDKDWGKNETLAMKRGNKKTTLLAFVSALDLPSVYLGKNNGYCPTMKEDEVYNNWIYDNIYTHNGLFSQDLAGLTKQNVGAENLINGFSAMQRKWLENSKDLYHNKRNVEKIADYSTILTVNGTGTGQATKNFKGFALNFFPTLTFTGFKIELDNNSNTIKNILDNPNSEYNRYNAIIKSLYKVNYNIGTGNLDIKTYIYNDRSDVVTGDGVSTGENYDFKYKTTGDTVHYIRDFYNKNGDNKKLLERTKEDYNTITKIHNGLKALIKKLDKESLNLYNNFMNNSTESNYKKFIDKYAEQIVYTSLYNIVKKVYYPIKFAYENNVFSGFTTVNGDSNSQHISFVSNIIYDENTKDKLTRQIVDNYRKVLNKIESYHYTRKKQQMIKDEIYKTRMSKLVDSYNTTPANKAEVKLNIIMKNVMAKDGVKKIVKKAQSKYTKDTHSIYTYVDYNKFKRFTNVPDSVYNKSNILGKVVGIFNNDNLKDYYTLGELYNLRTNLHSVYDLSNNYIVESF